MALSLQSGPGIGLTTKPLAGNNNFLSLPAGQVYTVPAGQYYIDTGAYLQIQTLDPIAGIWRELCGVGTDKITFVNSDGVNVRVANLTGCPIGSIVTNVGSGYTSAPVVTASAGASVWRAIVGGAINTTVTITTAGSGYTYPPQVIFDAPPPGGVQATATCTISGGVINAVTVVNQGAGYTAIPAITIVNDPRDSTGSAAKLTPAITGANTITAVLCTDHGTPLTAVPTLSFSGGGGSSAAATVAMCFTTTAFTVGSGGTAYGNAQPFLVQAVGGIVSATAGAVVNPQLSVNRLTPRMGLHTGTTTAGGAIQATGAVIQDGGLFQAVPVGIVTAGGSALATAVGQVTMTVGGVTDTFMIQPFA
jgi:hypothetical protein